MPKKSAPKQITLNEEQQAVVQTRNGFWKVEAGPGSGKSACVVTRYASLIQEGVSPDNVISLSFTSTAAKNLRDRVEGLVGKLESTRVSGAVTFHSLALSFAQQESDAYPFKLADFPLCSEPVANKYAAEVGRKHDIDGRVLRSAISVWKRGRISPTQAVRDSETRLDPKQLKLALAYKGYEAKLKENGLVDFDGLIFYMVQIMDKSEEVRQRWVRPVIQVDEAQDLSKIEWDLVKMISGESVLAVGDLSQGLYSFRGSDSRLFANMDEIFPGTKTLYLGRNYRSTPEIVDFIRPYSLSKDLAEKFHTTNEHGPTPKVVGFQSAAEESAWVVQQIKESM